MRGGSKGVPNKNLRKLHGTPLMAYTIKKAIKSGIFDHVMVSSDSNEIIETAKSFGADAWFVRPSELATDSSPKIPVIRHAFLEAEKHYDQEFEIIMDLDATSPLRSGDDIINSYNQFITEDANILISATSCRKNPYFNMLEKVNGRVQKVKELNTPVTRRQDAPLVYDMNASIYIWKRSTLLNQNTLFTEKTSLYVMPEERSLDIDTELDWEFVEFITGKGLGLHD